MAVPTLLFSLQLLVGAVNFESSVKSDGLLVAVKGISAMAAQEKT